MKLTYQPIAWQAIQDPAFRVAFKQTDDNQKAAFDALTAIVSVDARRGGEVALEAPITPRVLTADPTLSEAFGRKNEVAVLPTGQAFLKLDRTGTDRAWTPLLGSIMPGTFTPHAAFFGIPNSVDLEPISSGSSVLFARADHHHDLDQDIAPSMTNAWAWAPDKDVVVITLLGRDGQTENYRESYDPDGTTLHEILTPNFLQGYDDPSPAARRSIQARSGIDEDDVTDLGPVFWVDASDANLADNVGLADGDAVDPWHDKAGTDNYAAKEASSTKSPRLYTTPGSNPRPATLPNNKPVVSTKDTGGTAFYAELAGYSGVTETTFSLTDYTMSAVIPNNTGVGAFIGGTPSNGWLLSAPGCRIDFIFDAGNYYLRAQYRNTTTSNIYVAGPVTFPSGNWIRVTLVRSGSVHTFYVNDDAVPQNVPLCSGSFSETLYISNLQASWVGIGAGNGTLNFDSSPLAELLLFDSALAGDGLGTLWAYLDTKYYDGSNYLANSVTTGTAVALDEWKNSAGSVLSQVGATVKWAIGWAGPAVKRLDVRDSGGWRLGSNATPTGYLDMVVADSGLVTYDATGSGTPEHRFADLVNVRAAFHVGSADQLVVDTAGDLAKIKNLSYSWPSAHTTLGKLQDNGTGTLSWVADDADLTAIGALTGTGLLARTAADTWALRTLQAPAAGFTITNPGGVLGDPTFVLANDLAALEGLSLTGIAVRTATDAWAQRTITGSDSRITVTNPGGVAGNIDLTVPGAALTKVDDTNVTLTLGGTPATALLAAASLTLGWTGQLSLARGGTAANLTAVNGGIVYSGAAAFAISAAGSSGQILRSGGAGAPTWSTATYPATAGTSGNILQSDGTNIASVSLATAGIQPLDADLTEIAAVANVRGDMLVTNSGPTWVRIAVGAANTFLKSDGTDPSWTAGAALTKTDDTNVTLTLGGAPTTALVNAASLTLGWTGQLSVARGGTGLAALTANNLLVGAGTSAVTFIAPGTSGNILQSNGTLFQSVSLASAGIVAGTGTVDTLAKFTGTGTIGNSHITDTGAGIIIDGTAIGTSVIGDFSVFVNGVDLDLNVTTGAANFAAAVNVAGTLSANNADIIFTQTGLRVQGGDTNYLTLKPNEFMTAPRVLNLLVNNVDRTINLSGNLTVSSGATVSGTNTGDQAGANPTGTVGLSAVNGSALTFLRSDGAPALSQSIVPTWTGVHTFSALDVHNAGVDLGTSGRLDSHVADAASANSFLLKPSVSLTSGQDRRIFSLQDSAGTTLLDVKADRTWEFGGTGSSRTAYVSMPAAVNISGVFSVLNLASTITSPGGTVGGASAATVVGAQFIATESSAGSSDSAVGGVFSATVGGGRAHSVVAAGVFAAQSAGACGFTLTDSFGWRVLAYSHNATGTAATNAYGGYVAAHTSGTNRYGLRVLEQTGGTINNGLLLDSATAGYKCVAIGDQNSWLAWESSSSFSLNSTTVLCKADLKISNVGNGLYVKEGTNATMGVATLVLGAAVVSTTKVTANSRILLTAQSLGTVALPKSLAVTARTAGTSFAITSSDPTDTSVVAWMILEPA